MTNDTEIKKLLGRRIRELRTKRGYTQEQLAEMIDVGQRNLSKIECGSSFVTAETLSKILNALDIQAKDLFNFSHNNDKEILKNEMLHAIADEKIDIELMYRFYETIK